MPHQTHRKASLRSLVLTVLASAPLLASAATTNWVAYNDHRSGTGTAPNVSTWSPDNAVVTLGGPLINFASGEVLPVGVSIAVVGSTLDGDDGTAVAPNAGTPADLAFAGKVDYTSSAFYFCNTPYTASFTITFTNLDAAKKYVFKGVPQRGGGTGGTYPQRWGSYMLVGATSATPAHEQGPGSPGVVTNGWSPYGDLMAPNTQVAINCGNNLAGDMIVWTEIVPDGTSFSVVSSNWLAALPGGLAANPTYAYAINAFSLEEVEAATTPVAIVTEPVGTNVIKFRPFSLRVQASGSAPQYQWYKVGTGLIDGATSRTYSVAEAQLTDTGDYYVLVSNSANSVQSATVHVEVLDDNVPPTIVGAVGSADFKTITVQFSEKMNTNGLDEFSFMVDPALQVTGFRMTNASTVMVLSAGDAAAQDTTYTVTFPAELTDLAGNSLPEPRTVQFKSWVNNPFGGVVFQVYTNLSTTDNSLAQLTNNANFPYNPAETYSLYNFNSREAYLDDSHEGYGGRLRSLFIPSVSGKYRLFIRSDDFSQLYFNPNGTDPAGKLPVADVSGTCCQAFQEPPSAQTTAPFDLVAGRGYYLEALYKEGTGGDYCLVAARLEGDLIPAATLTNLMDSSVGAMAVPAGIVGTMSITQQPANTTVAQPAPATFSVGAQTTLGSPFVYQWQRSDDGGTTFVDVPNATERFYHIAATTVASDNLAQVRVIVKSPAGVLTSDTATLTVTPDVTPPAVVSAVRMLNGTTIVLTYSEPVLPGSASDTFSYTICNAYGLTPCVVVTAAQMTNNNTQVILETAPPTAGITYRVTVTADVTDAVGNPVANPDNAVVQVPVTFQQGDLNGFSGTVDTHVRSDNPTTSYGTLVAVLSDNLSPLSHALIRFDNIFGLAEGQIPPGSVIESAMLYLRTDNWGNDIRVHRMLVPWSGSSIWNDVGSPNDGVSLTLGDAVATPETTFATIAVGVTTNVNVTASVQFWATNGGPNYGWGLINSGDDGYQFNSSEAADATQRPQLVVYYKQTAETNPVVIVVQPAATNIINEGQTVTLAVEVTGTKPIYQWYKNDTLIPGADRASYGISNAVPTDSGKYYCRISNLANSVQSQDSWLTVIPDTTGLVVLSAQGGRETNNTILVSFSERLNPASAETASNYELLGSGSITILSAVLSSDSSVTLTLSGARTPGENYQLRVKDVKDAAVALNVITPNPTTLPVSTLVEVISINTQVWKYLQQTVDGQPAPCLDGTPWTESSYDDNLWQSGPGLFYGLRDPVQPYTATTTLDGSTVSTFLNVFTNGVPANGIQQTNCYFRTTFNLPSVTTNGATLLIHSMVDDGAVFYLNGNRVGDVRYTANPAYCTNFASAGGSQTWEPALASPGRVLGLTGLMPGQNTLAVQVAQNNGTSSDITLGVLLEADVVSLLPPAPKLGSSYDSGTQTLTLSWTATGYELVGGPTVSGPWTQVSATSPAVVSTATGTRFYQLRKP